MTKLSIVLERKKDGKVHKTRLTEDVRLHLDIIDKLYSRLVKKGILIEIDELMDMRIS